MVAGLVIVGLVVEAVGLCAHQRHLSRQGGEGAAAHFEQTTKFGYTYVARNAGLFFGFALSVMLLITNLNDSATFILLLLVTTIVLLTAVTGRALFYALVMPTTMPGAFFWCNKSFQEHARETGLAEMPQVGVLPETH